MALIAVASFLHEAADVLFIAFVVVFLLLWALLTFVMPPVWSGVTWIASKAAASSMRYGFVKRAVGVAGPFRDYLPVALIFIIGIVVCVAAGDGFLDLAELVHENSPVLQRVDANVHDWAVSERSAGATTFFQLMSAVGGPGGLTAILGIVLIGLLFYRRFRWLLYLAVTVAGGGLLDLELKRFYARARPDIAEQLMHATGYSFPSGHAMGSTVAFGALAYLAFRVLPQWWQRSAAVAFAITMILSVATSRVYLGVHWISDVTAGIVCGVLWVSVTTAAYETLRRVRAIRLMRKNAMVA